MYQDGVVEEMEEWEDTILELKETADKVSESLQDAEMPLNDLEGNTSMEAALEPGPKSEPEAEAESAAEVAPELEPEPMPAPERFGSARCASTYPTAIRSAGA